MSFDDDLIGAIDEFQFATHHKTLAKSSAALRKNSIDAQDAVVFLTEEEMKTVKETGDEGLPLVLPDTKPEQTFVFKRYSDTDSNYERRYSEKELEQIREGCLRTIVYDYGDNDWYHMSDEQRERMDQLSEIAPKLGGLVRIYHKVDKFVGAMRIVFEAWKILAEKNLIHDREEFFKMVGDGTIISDRIIMPKFRNLNKYNSDVIMKYIADPTLDPEDLLDKKPEEPDPWAEEDELDLCDELTFEELTEVVNGDIEAFSKLTKEEVEAEFQKFSEQIDLAREEKKRRNDELRKEHDEKLKALKYVLFLPEEVEYLEKIEAGEGEESEFEVRELRGKYKDVVSKRKRKKMKKSDRLIRDTTMKMMRHVRPAGHNNRNDIRRIYGVTDDLFTEEKKYASPFDMVPFTGSWMDDDDVDFYDVILDEAVMNLPADEENHYGTIGDLETQQFFRIMEQSGMNVVQFRRNLQGNYSEEKQAVQASRRQNRKIVNKVVQRIHGLSNNPKFKKIINRAEIDLLNYKKEETFDIIEED